MAKVEYFDFDKQRFTDGAPKIITDYLNERGSELRCCKDPHWQLGAEVLYLHAASISGAMDEAHERKAWPKEAGAPFLLLLCVNCGEAKMFRLDRVFPDLWKRP